MESPVVQSSKTDTTDKLVTCLIIGAGQRGQVYGNFALDFPERLKVVSVCEPKDFRRLSFKSKHLISDDLEFSTWTQVNSKIADFVIIATPDATHCEITLHFSKLKYHILVEKPMATSKEECLLIQKAVKKSGVLFGVCHVLRYAPVYMKLGEILRSNAIGKIMHISHREPIGYYHFAHSYVRGNWRKENISSFLLMTKCCHDVDLIRYFASSPCKSVSSFGSLSFFKKENKPIEATNFNYCLECPLQDSCIYSAKSIYLKQFLDGNSGWPVSVICEIPTKDSILDSLKGNYGRCVFECDNDVVDHQIVSFEFCDFTASLEIISTTELICQRETKIYGSLGEISCDMKSLDLTIFGTSKSITSIPLVKPPQTSLTGHGGSDYFLMDSFVKAVARNDASLIKTNIDDSTDSHLLVFSIEEARKERKIVLL